ncbi:MAG: GNAT family N-acetyltransferase, partial [Myxococcota bacterium]
HPGAGSTGRSAEVITHARPEDASVLRDLAVESFADDLKRYGGKPPGTEVLDHHVRKIACGHYYKIEAEGRIAGGLIVALRGPSAAEIELLFVAPRHHNRGLGGQALRSVEARYPEVTTWTLVTPEGDGRTRRFYERYGFRQVGRLPATPSRTPDLLQMEKVLATRGFDSAPERAAARPT